MRFAVLSQSGAVGKTTLALALAEYLKAPLYELEVGFPKLWPKDPETLELVTWRLSRFDRRKCDLCEECVKNCQFQALVREGEVIKHRGHRCRGCGLCKEICPRKAISLKEIKLGEVAKGSLGPVSLYAARFLRGGTVEGVLWRRLFERFPPEEKAVFKAPTGLNGESLQAAKEAEALILVTIPERAERELRLFAELVQGTGLPGGVVVSFSETDEFRSQAESLGLFWLGTIPYIPEVSTGKSLLEAWPAAQEMLSRFEGVG